MNDTKIQGLVSADGTIASPAAEGQSTSVLVDAHGRLWTTDGGGPDADNYGEYNAGAELFSVVGPTATGTVSAIEVNAVESQLHYLSIMQPEGSSWSGYIQIHDKASAPAALELPKYRLQVRDGEQIVWEPRYALFTNGIWVVSSTTANGYTADAAKTFILDAVWEATA